MTEQQASRFLWWLSGVLFGFGVCLIVMPSVKS